MSQITDLVEAIEQDMEDRVVKRVIAQLTRGIITANTPEPPAVTHTAKAPQEPRKPNKRRRGPHGPITATDHEVMKVRQMLTDLGVPMTPKQIHRADASIGARKAFSACIELQKAGLVEHTKDGYRILMTAEESSLDGQDSSPEP